MLGLAMASLATLLGRVDRLLEATPSPPPAERGLLYLTPVAVAVCALLVTARVRAAKDLAQEPLAQALLQDATAADPERRATALFRLARWQGREAETLPLMLARPGLLRRCRVAGPRHRPLER